MPFEDLLKELNMRQKRQPGGVRETGEGFAPVAEDYLRRLQEAVHDADKFPVVFEQLRAERSLKREDLVELASRFAFPMAKSTTKRLAMERIWRQHEASERAGAKVRSMSGRTAA